MIKPNTNYVLVRPIGTPGHHHKSGLLVAEFAETHLLKPCFGIIEAVCDDLYYGGHEVLMYGKDVAGDNLERVRAINERSLSYDVDMEVKVGDIVLFRYIVHMDEDVTLPDGRMLIRYDDLIGRLQHSDPELTHPIAGYDTSTGEWLFLANSLYPLNGAILVEMRDVGNESGVLDSGMDKEVGWGTVVSEGMLVRSYLLWPEKGGDFDVSLAGKTISFNHKAAVRIEEDTFRLLNTETKYPLYYLYRAFVTGYLDG
ncbi:MAG: hypothetical protein IT269_11330 [Saprospiraceae bacterium]|nr:hypothetical protein [Saprospiraceae bacterium]